MKLPKYMTTVTPFSKSIALILVILLPFIGFFIGVEYQKSIRSIAVVDIPTAAIPQKSAYASMWKTYTSEKGYFSIQYPPSWMVKPQPGEVGLYKSTVFTGKEGSVTVDVGTGFGGACGGDYGPPLEKFTIGKDTFDVCHNPDSTDHSETWSLISKDFGTINGVDVGVNVSAQANAPTKINRDVVLKVLKSLKFQIK